MMVQRIDLELRGCRTQPLLSYLKALGVLRLVAEQADPTACAVWQEESFHLHSALDRAALMRFLLEAYAPTPVASPWGGGSGFFAKDRKEAVTAIKRSVALRFENYRQVIGAVERVLGDTKRDKPTKQEKGLLLNRYRAELPDAALPWLDAVLVLTDEAPIFAPLLGTGGNDGRLDFGRNFMERLVEVLPVAAGFAQPLQSAERLVLALFGEGNAALTSAAVGQFDPGGVGGPNAEPGFEAESLVNPWDYVLMIEGTMLLAGAVARRLGSEGRGRAAFPFTVSSSAAGWRTLASGEPMAARAELWLPIWQWPASKPELAQLFAEGRAQVGRRQSRSGVDFARAVAGLGVNRGISAFERYGFLRRSGKNFIAAPLGRMPVRAQSEVGLLDELDRWLGRLRQTWTGANGPQRWRAVLRAIDEAMFACAEFGGARRLGEVLAALGRAERYLAVSGKESRQHVSPLSLSPRWLRACDDESPEFRIAAALASIDDAGVGPIRCQLEPVAKKNGRWNWTDGNTGIAWGAGSLVGNLAAVLGRRCVQAGSHAEDGQSNGSPPAISGARTLGGEGNGPRPLPVGGRLRVSLWDVHQFLSGSLEDARIADLLWGLATVRWSELRSAPTLLGGAAEQAPEISRAYALLKLLFLPHPLARPGEQEGTVIRPELAILSRLRAGAVPGAVEIACRRLRASGFQVAGMPGSGGRYPDYICSGIERSRLAAALLLPIWQTPYLTQLVLRLTEPVEAGL